VALADPVLVAKGPQALLVPARAWDPDLGRAWEGG
jgi:hypothetical protein